MNIQDNMHPLFKYINIVGLKRDRSIAKDADKGFTLLELLLVVLIIGILATIGIPSWVSLVNRTKIKNARSEIFQTIRQAQSQAKQKKVNFEASFQNATNSEGQAIVQWSVHPDGGTPNWQSITVPGVEVEADNTTLDNASGWWAIAFDEQGQVAQSSNTGKITVVNSNNAATKRCVFVESLLGAMRSANDSECES